MPPFIMQLWEQSVAIWNGLQLPQRVTAVMFLIGSVIMISMIGFWSSQPDYVPLASDLTPAEMTEISALLKDRQIEVKYESSRGMLMVPAGKLTEAKQMLANAGLGVSQSSTFDGLNSGFGDTDTIQKEKLRRALQSSLEKNIQSMDGIEKAIVTISTPSEQLFVRDQQDAKASVTLIPKRNRQLTPSTILAVQQIVASSVPRLKASNVAVVDSSGRVLAKNVEDPNDLALSTSQNLEARKRTEQHLTRKVEDLLDQAIGPGRAAIQVSAELDFDWIERNLKKVDPSQTGGVTVQESKTTKDRTGASGGSGGVPGIKANTPGGNPGGATVAGGSPERTKEADIQNKYDFDVLTERTRKEVGSIKRLQVGVMVKPFYNEADKKYVAMSPEDLNKIANIVKNAVGFSEQRKDVVTVENAPEPVSPTIAFTPVPAPGTGFNLTDWKELLPSVLTWVAILAVALIFLRTMRRISVTGKPFESTVTAQGGTTIRNVTVNADGEIEEEIIEVKDDTPRLQGEIKTLVGQNTSQATEVIRLMLKQ